ncbi:putative manganese-dependent inorganic diphosphatase [Clostridium sp. 19966]|uniref:putative manganese-dependent inorganic diphosphatase n=1 Tax=Clostridium sp. 19966 TaxID=2768166 RepID=UPI0028DD5A34|nr:putative manganese-dependent inorganic diphosphatase [Clostridium sp. 19966]MDT8716632.1 putative manganese-dependent inorganic diphosphatase [Clostridium sp. 19966]
MNDIIYITGHKNPDSDSICSAIAYAEFKNKTQSIPAVPVRLGELNNETKFILEYFDIKPPMLIDTVKAQVADLSMDKIAPVSADISLKMAWSLMKKHSINTLPVTNEHNNLIGMLSTSNLITTFMDVWDDKILSKSNTKIENIIEALSAKVKFVSDKEPTYHGKILVSSVKEENIIDKLEKGDVVICDNSSEMQKLIIEKEASVLVVTDNKEVNDDILELAKSKDCSVIITPFDAFTASRLITQSIPISYVMTRDNIVSFNTDDFVDEVKDIMLETRYRSYPVLDNKDKVIGSISRYHLISKNKKKIIILDHSEKSQSVHGLEDADILEIIDHHRIADIQTGNPIYYRNEPVGSTCTIVASIFFENGIKPSKKAAGVLCAAIISDTLLLKSPTTTNVDRMILKRLAAIAEIDPEKFSKEMFKAGTSLKGKTLEQIFHQDYKTFSVNDVDFGVSQVGTMDIDSFDPMKEEMLAYMEEKATKGNFNFLLLLVTDILNGGSKIIAAGPDKDLVPRTFNVTLDENNSAFLPEVVSRKKQVIPPLSTTITNG